MVWRCSYGVVNCPECRRPDRPVSPKIPGRFADYNAVVPSEHRAYLATRFSDKNTVKGLGARWDAERRQWYADRRQSLEPFQRWLPKGAIAAPPPAAQTRAEATGRMIERAKPATNNMQRLVRRIERSTTVQAEPVSEAEISAMLATPTPVAPNPEPVSFTFDDILAATGNVDTTSRATFSGAREVALDMCVERVMVTRSNHA